MILFKKLQKKFLLVKKLIETGYTGRKGKGGFYRMNKTGAIKIMEAINLETGEYSASKKINIKSDKVDLKILDFIEMINMVSMLGLLFQRLSNMHLH